MNFSKDDMIQQQQLLTALGFYKGKIDGIWSTETIKAKIAYERTKEFAPAVPNDGLPFDFSKKLPRNVMRKAGVLWHPKLEQYLQQQKDKNHVEARPVANSGKNAPAATAEQEQPTGE